MTQAYPLHWPDGWPRTKTPTKSQLKTPIIKALNNLENQLCRFGQDAGLEVKNIIISTNYTLTDRSPENSAVAVYFVWDGVQNCIAVDRYTKIEDNVQSIAKVIEAERTKLRHGGLHIVRKSFRGFAALPPPDTENLPATRPWNEVLGIPENATLTQARAAWFKLVKTYHPDKGGDANTFNQIVDAWKEAQQEVRD